MGGCRPYTVGALLLSAKLNSAIFRDQVTRQAGHKDVQLFHILYSTKGFLYQRRSSPGFRQKFGAGSQNTFVYTSSEPTVQGKLEERRGVYS